MYWLVGLMGLLMMAVPFVFQATTNTLALWTSIVLGALVVIAAGYKAIVKDEEARWEYWLAGIVGIAAIIAPFAFQFSALTTLMWTMIALGVILVLVDGYEVFTHREAM